MLFIEEMTNKYWKKILHGAFAGCTELPWSFCKDGHVNGPIFQMSSTSCPSIISYINLLYVSAKTML